MYKIFNTYINICFNNYKYYIINNFEKLLEKKESLKSISTISTLILIMIDIYIKLTRFLNANILEILYNLNKKIKKRLVIIKRICKRLIFNSYISLN